MEEKSEIRLDPITKDWVIIASNRLKRPEDFKEKEIVVKSNKNCPFCKLENEEFIIAEAGGKIISEPKELPDNWDIVVIYNKYPAVSMGQGIKEAGNGPYRVIGGVGSHEVVVTRSHTKNFFNFSKKEIREIIKVYLNRFLSLKKEKEIRYISIFHNYGEKAGASLSHPHSQIIAVPVEDPDVWKSLNGSRDYWLKNKKCIHCQIIDWEIEKKERIVYENASFVAICPFASKMSFQIRIYQKKHSPYFEEISDKEIYDFAEILQKVLSSLGKSLNNPPFNFYLRTSPVDGSSYPYFHWYLEILPRTSIQAGFEFGAGIEISTIKPEKAADYLRKRIR